MKCVSSRAFWNHGFSSSGLWALHIGHVPMHWLTFSFILGVMHSFVPIQMYDPLHSVLICHGHHPTLFSNFRGITTLLSVTCFPTDLWNRFLHVILDSLFLLFPVVLLFVFGWAVSRIMVTQHLSKCGSSFCHCSIISTSLVWWRCGNYSQMLEWYSQREDQN